MDSLSLGNSKTMYGIKIRKLPIGKYLELIKKVNVLGKDLLEKGFNNKSIEEILNNIINLDKIELIKLMESAFNTAPELVMDFLADILEVDKEKLMDNEEIGLYELIEIVEEFIKINNLGKLIQKLKKWINILPMKIENTGYKS